VLGEHAAYLADCSQYVVLICCQGPSDVLKASDAGALADMSEVVE